ncbi:MAG: hypothetical protein JSS27_01095 [Planctomycetes bacterium]|nr:hypothetical protein [Planctomycetota bacterium]
MYLITEAVARARAMFHEATPFVEMGAAEVVALLKPWLSDASKRAELMALIAKEVEAVAPSVAPAVAVAETAAIEVAAAETAAPAGAK